MANYCQLFNISMKATPEVSLCIHSVKNTLANVFFFTPNCIYIYISLFFLKKADKRGSLNKAEKIVFFSFLLPHIIYRLSNNIEKRSKYRSEVPRPKLVHRRYCQKLILAQFLERKNK